MAIRLITGRLQQWSNVCKNNFTKKDSMRIQNYIKMFATTCGVHKPPHYTTPEDRLSDQRRNKTQACWLTFLSEIGSQTPQSTPCPRHRFVQYGLDRGGWLALILGHCRCAG